MHSKTCKICATQHSYTYIGSRSPVARRFMATSPPSSSNSPLSCLLTDQLYSWARSWHSFASWASRREQNPSNDEQQPELIIRHYSKHVNNNGDGHVFAVVYSRTLQAVVPACVRLVTRADDEGPVVGAAVVPLFHRITESFLHVRLCVVYTQFRE